MPTAANANEIRLSCKGWLEESTIKGSEAGVKVITDMFKEKGITNYSREIVINKDSSLATISETGGTEINTHQRAPFFETSTEYIIKIQDSYFSGADQVKQHKINRTDGSYTYI